MQKSHVSGAKETNVLWPTLLDRYQLLQLVMSALVFLKLPMGHGKADSDLLPSSLCQLVALEGPAA